MNPPDRATDQIRRGRNGNRLKKEKRSEAVAAPNRALRVRGACAARRGRVVRLGGDAEYTLLGWFPSFSAAFLRGAARAEPRVTARRGTTPCRRGAVVHGGNRPFLTGQNARCRHHHHRLTRRLTSGRQARWHGRTASDGACGGEIGGGAIPVATSEQVPYRLGTVTVPRRKVITVKTTKHNVDLKTEKVTVHDNPDNRVVTARE